MLRAQVNQEILDLYANPAYLEIGVAHGETFLPIRASSKVAVDPRFAFDYIAAQNALENSHCEFHQITSDEYFATLHQQRKFDVIFIDGLHTFGQTLRDFLSGLACLTEKGVIVVDDVIPASFAASIDDPFLFERFQGAVHSQDGTWMGDVYRLVFFIKHYMPFLCYATVEENHGQMVVWRGRRSTSEMTDLSVEQVARLNYIDVVLQKNSFRVSPLSSIIQRLREMMAGGSS